MLSGPLLVCWSVGLLVGQIIGAAVMALHAVQGPRLGLPQMIISRIQFGVFGAVIPLVLVCIMYIGFSASDTVLAGQAMAKLLHINNAAGMILFSLIIVVIAVLGYRVIHKLGKVASIIGMLAFLYLFARLLSTHDLAQVWQNRHFPSLGFCLRCRSLLHGRLHFALMSLTIRATCRKMSRRKACSAPFFSAQC